MAENEHQEIIIIKRHAAHDEESHGGAWKIAFADFMTALMALFLVLWLIASTSEKAKVSIARYFNPVKLVDMTTLKKGFKDPLNTEPSAGDADNSNTIPSADQPDHIESFDKKKGRKDSNIQSQARSEAELLSNPYEALTKIIEADVPVGPQQENLPLSGSGDPMSGGTPDRFRDPFSTIKSLANAEGKIGSEAEDKKAEKYASETGLLAKLNIPTSNSAKPLSDLSIGKASQQSSPGADQSRTDPGVDTNEAAKLAVEINNELNSDTGNKAIPHIEVKSTDEGILISLTDDVHFSMFAIGSAEPQARTIQIMAKIAALLKARSGSIVIRGYTDGRPFKSPIYDNWRLSSARAHMAQYMLIRGGMEENRIEKIEGYADRHLKNPTNPEAMENRRIEILLRKEKA